MHFITVLIICFQSLIIYGIGLALLLILTDRDNLLQEQATIISCFSVFLLTILWFSRKTKIEVHKNGSEAHSNYWSSAEISYILILFLGLMAAVPQYVNGFKDGVIKLNQGHLIEKKDELKILIESYQDGICRANNKSEDLIPIYVSISSFCEELSTLDVDNVNSHYVLRESMQSYETHGAQDVLDILFKSPPSIRVWERIEDHVNRKHLESEHIVSFLKMTTKCNNDLLCEKLDNIRAYPLNDQDKLEWESIRLILDKYIGILRYDSDFSRQAFDVYSAIIFLKEKEIEPRISITIGNSNLFLVLALFPGAAPLLFTVVLGLRITKGIAGYKDKDKKSV